ncbi:unnamed protein product [Gordionus sp. m RMFG-2023]
MATFFEDTITNNNQKIDKSSFILSVKEYECLYNKHHHLYKNNIYKNKVWGLLAQEYKTTVTSLKSLWKNLRDCFIKERQKLVKLKSGSGSDHQITWPFYHDMLFMVETITPRSQKSSLDKEDSSSIEVRDIFNEMTGENDCDFIDTYNTSDVTVINKDSVTLNLIDSGN